MSRTISIEYIIKDEKGAELARFQDLEEAKRYDRMLAAADELYELIGGIKELKKIDDGLKDELSFQLAKHSEEIIGILSSINSKKKSSKKEAKQTDQQFAEVAELKAVG
jgi:dsDNA-binding SOS-regulon protein